MKLALLFRNFGPYHIARLHALARHCDVFGIEAARDDDEYGWPRQGDTPIASLSERRPLSRIARLAVCRLDGILTERKPDAIAIPGWYDPLALAALGIALRRGVAPILMSDSRAEDQPRFAILEAAKKRLVLNFGAALVAGQSQSRYLQQLGMDTSRICMGYDVVDNAHFAAGADAARANAGTLRRKLVLPDNYFFACARLIAKKNIDGLLRAFAQYRVRGGAWSLVIAGDGPLKSELASLARSLGISAAVQFAGHKSYAELPVYYSLARAFVMPSATDQWGLVVNEAMACSLPVLVSSNAGCAEDLVADGENGFAFEPTDTGRLAALLEKISSALNLDALGANSRVRIAKWDLDRFASGMLASAAIAMQSRRAPGSLDSALIRLLAWR
jgi:glycosyltransferase involved in cell wall biosynthesis